MAVNSISLYMHAQKNKNKNKINQLLYKLKQEISPHREEIRSSCSFPVLRTIHILKTSLTHKS